MSTKKSDDGKRKDVLQLTDLSYADLMEHRIDLIDLTDPDKEIPAGLLGVLTSRFRKTFA